MGSIWHFRVVRWIDHERVPSVGHSGDQQNEYEPSCKYFRRSMNSKEALRMRGPTRAYVRAIEPRAYPEGPRYPNMGYVGLLPLGS